MDTLVNQYEKKIKLVSFDIFDTLLFRLTKDSESVFFRMYERNRRLFPPDITAEGWMRLRVGVEQQTRQQKYKSYGTWDVTIEEIYNNMPEIFLNKDELMAKEIETETIFGYLNPEIWNLLCKFHEKGIPIVLTSDMYLHKNMMREILLGAGADLNIVDDIFVSCDYGFTKMSGELYQVVLDKYHLLPHQMLHIGDNYESDIGAAKLVGIFTHHYSLVSNGKFRCSELYLENLRFPEMTGVLNNIRLLADNRLKGDSCEDYFWHHLGACCVGPILTGFADWIVSYARAHGVTYIFPMMREGKFLGKLIQNSALQQKVELKVNNFYVSRLALMKSTMDNITEKDITYLAKTHGVTVGDVFKVLNIPELIGRYTEYADVLTCDIDSVAQKRGDDTYTLDVLIEELTTEDMIACIQRKNRKCKEVFLKYFEQVGLFNGGFTIDVGWKGSLHSILTEFLKNQNINIKLENLLMCSTSMVVENLMNGSVIKGYIGNCCDDFSNVALIYPRLVELFLGCDEGTTVGYELQDGKVVPVLKDVDYPATQKKKIRLLQEGVIYYQETFYDVLRDLEKSKTSDVYRWMEGVLRSQRDEEKYILLRLLCNPFKREAEELSELLYDQNFGGNHFEPILDEYLLETRSRTSASQFWGNFQTNHFEWYCGFCVRRDGLIYYKNAYIQNAKFANLKLIGLLENFLEKLEDNNFVLVGAGSNTEDIFQYCKAIGIEKRIVGIIDNNERKQYSSLYGYEIHEVGWKFDTSNFLITVFKTEFIGQLKEQLIECYGNDVFIGSYC